MATLHCSTRKNIANLDLMEKLVLLTYYEFVKKEIGNQVRIYVNWSPVHYMSRKGTYVSDPPVMRLQD